MTIYLPDICSKNTVYTILGQVFDQEGLLFSNQYTFDAKSLSQLDPVGLVTLNNLFSWLDANDVRVEIVSPDPAGQPSHSLLHYIHSGGYPINDSMNVQQRTIPLAHVGKDRSSPWVLSVFNRWLAELLGASTLTVFPYTQFLRLLVRYAVHYAQAKGFFLHATLDDMDNTLHIVMAHYGMGIPHLIRSSWNKVANDAVVIAKATETAPNSEKASVQNDSSLYFLIDDVVLEFGGEVAIYSEFGRMICTPSSLGITQKLELSDGFYPGTLFDVTFSLANTDLLSRVNEPVVEGEAFERSLIREVSAKPLFETTNS